MTINLNTDELTELVSQKMQDMGLVGDYEISFKGRNQGMVDTVIEILSTDTVSTEATEQPDLVKATEFDDSLIK